MGRIIDQVLGQEQPLNQLVAAYQKGHLPHALIFLGPDGVGKKLSALAMAQFLVCESGDKLESELGSQLGRESDRESVSGPESDKPCGHCGSCIRIEKKQSENLLIIEDAGANIKIQESRAILDFLSLASFNKNRVIIIDDAHLLTSQAANALLKTLEEPQSRVYFFLITTEESLLLQTIQSRCQKIRFKPLTVDQLRTIKPHLPSWTYATARGQLSKLEKLAGDNNEQKRVQYLSWLEDFLLNKDFIKDGLWREISKDREAVQEMLNMWSLALRDILFFRHGSEFIFNKDQKSLFQNLSKVSSAAIEQLIFEIISASQSIKGNADATLTVEALWIKNARSGIESMVAKGASA